VLGIVAAWADSRLGRVTTTSEIDIAWELSLHGWAFTIALALVPSELCLPCTSSNSTFAFQDQTTAIGNSDRERELAY
jgi:hypothetical protein